MVQTYPICSKMKAISTCCLTADGQSLLLGTEGGNIYILNIPSFTLADQIIYQDIVMQKLVCLLCLSYS